MKYENELEDRVGGLGTANMHWERSLNVEFSPCQLRTVRCSPVLCFETLQLASCLGKPNMLVIPFRERLTSHW
jgi:hypothetical protein